MASVQTPFGVVALAENSPRLWASEDPETYLLAADEAEASARWGDRVAAELTRDGHIIEALREQQKGRDDRRRARVLRETAERLRGGFY